MKSTIFSMHSTTGNSHGHYSSLKPVLANTELEFALIFAGPGQLDSFILDPRTTSLPTPFYGCTTSGEITPSGYADDSVVCLGFARKHFTAVARRIEGLDNFDLQSAQNLILSAKRELSKRAPESEPQNTFALLFIDSMRQSEEFVAAAFGLELGNTVMMGGSAGDNWRLRCTQVLDRSCLYEDAALLLIVYTDIPFYHYNFHHYKPSPVRGVITSASPAQRLVHEINGVPAFQEYARLLGLEWHELDVEHFLLPPLIIMIGDKAYARGISQVLDDGTMQFACAIDEGMVFHVAKPGGYISELEANFSALNRELGKPVLTLSFECAGRRMEAERAMLDQEVADLFHKNNVWGFSSMGEQTNGVHMNSSFNCIAFGEQD